MSTSACALPVAASLPPWLRPGQVTALFQPIVDLTGDRHRVVAVEALARGPRDTQHESPVALFTAARREGVVAQLDRLCISAALEAAQQLPAHLDIFLNVHPTTLSHDYLFPAFLAQATAIAGVEPSRITLEVLEHSRVVQADCRQLRAACHVLRGHGLRMAVDDVSGAPEDVRRALSLRPDFLKVDALVVRGAQRECKLRALLHAIAEEALAAGVRVIAEGIEELRDLEAVATAGITLAQGYLLSRPAPVETFAHLMHAV